MQNLVQERMMDLSHYIIDQEQARTEYRLLLNLGAEQHLAVLNFDRSALVSELIAKVVASEGKQLDQWIKAGKKLIVQSPIGKLFELDPEQRLIDSALKSGDELIFLNTQKSDHVGDKKSYHQKTLPLDSKSFEQTGYTFQPQKSNFSSNRLSSTETDNSNLELRSSKLESLGSRNFLEPEQTEAIETQQLKIPEPPTKADHGKLSLIAAFASGLTGISFFVISGSWLALVGVAIAPLIILLSYGERSFSGKQDYKKKLQGYQKELEQFYWQFTTARLAEKRFNIALRNPVEQLAEKLLNNSSLQIDPTLQLGLEGAKFVLGNSYQKSAITIDWSSAPELLGLELNQLGQKITEAITNINQLETQLTEKTVEFELKPAKNYALCASADNLAMVLSSALIQILLKYQSNQLKIAFIGEEFSSALEVHPELWQHWNSRISWLKEKSELEKLTSSKGSAGFQLLIIHSGDPFAVRWVQEDLKAGAHNFAVLWVSKDLKSLPTDIDTVVSQSDQNWHLVSRGKKSRVDLSQVEQLPERLAIKLLRQICRTLDKNEKEPSSLLPEKVTIFELLKYQFNFINPNIEQGHLWLNRLREGRISELIAENWRLKSEEIKRVGLTELEAVVGRGSAGAVIFDLHSQGPHALLGGTTGAGKSEFLLNWLISLALKNSPEHLQLLLIDYKGGAAFSALKELPHLSGIITDLNLKDSSRVLVLLKAELKRREKLLADQNVANISELLQKTEIKLPSLLIVIDEFATLVRELPEFIDGVVDLAQRGRSLGVHLIMATQRPAGSVSQNLAANLNLRVALRTVTRQDSIDIVESAEAANFSPKQPGRALLRLSSGEFLKFQAGYTSAKAEALEPSSLELKLINSAAKRVRLNQLVPKSYSAEPNRAKTQLQFLVEQLKLSATAYGTRPELNFWKGPISAGFPLSKLNYSRGEIFRKVPIPIAKVDDPKQLAQFQLDYWPEEHGNLIISGGPGTGKSYALAALILSAARTRLGVAESKLIANSMVSQSKNTELISSGEPKRRSSRIEQECSRPCASNQYRTYLITNKQQKSCYQMLSGLVTVLDFDDYESVERLFRQLLKANKADKIAKLASVSSDSKIRSCKNQCSNFLVLIENLSLFRSKYQENIQQVGVYNNFEELLANPKHGNVNFIVTETEAYLVPRIVAQSSALSIELGQLPDYLKAKPFAELEPGSGVFYSKTNRLELVFPDPTLSKTDLLRTELSDQNYQFAKEIPLLPNLITEADLVNRFGKTLDHKELIIGLDYDQLAAVWLNTLEPLLITGSDKSTKESLLSYIRRSLLESNNFEHQNFFVIETVLDLDRVIARLAKAEQLKIIFELQEEHLSSLGLAPKLAELLRLTKQSDSWLVLACEPNGWTDWQLSNEFKKFQQHVILPGSDPKLPAPLEQLLSSKIPRGLATARGFFLRSGQEKLTQFVFSA